MITAEILKRAYPASRANLAEVADAINAACLRYGIDTPARVQAFVAQMAHETGQFNRLVESFAYKDPARLLLIFRRDFANLADAKAVHARGQQAIANRVYANQNGNGNETSGDGWRFRGRGFLQTTGRTNYRKTGEAIGVDLIAQPERLQEPKIAALAAGYYWSATNLNKLADAGDFDGVSDVINLGRKTARHGDANGFDDRVACHAAICRVMA